MFKVLPVPIQEVVPIVRFTPIEQTTKPVEIFNGYGVLARRVSAKEFTLSPLGIPELLQYLEEKLNLSFSDQTPTISSMGGNVKISFPHDISDNVFITCLKSCLKGYNSP